MKQIPMLDLRLEYEYMKEDIDLAINRCLDHQKWILGPEVKEFEDVIAQYLGVKHCIGVSSGTEALVLSLRALAIKVKGEEYFSKEDEINYRDTLGKVEYPQWYIIHFRDTR